MTEYIFKSKLAPFYIKTAAYSFVSVIFIILFVYCCCFSDKDQQFMKELSDVQKLLTEKEVTVSKEKTSLIEKTEKDDKEGLRQRTNKNNK